jgi:hypothetical protein
MNLHVKRIYKGATYTIGRLYIDNNYVCDTLEDEVREGPKVYSETAIPPGIYKVEWNFSIHFNRYLPQIMNVSGFEGIRIHSGNDSNDTSGCILVGCNTIKGHLTNSRIKSDFINTVIRTAWNNKEKITIIIE